MSRLLEPLTDAGRRFVSAVEAHAEAFRERARAHDRDGSFPVQNFDE